MFKNRKKKNRVDPFSWSLEGEIIEFILFRNVTQAHGYVYIVITRITEKGLSILNKGLNK